jgi:hypothetical protein
MIPGAFVPGMIPGMVPGAAARDNVPPPKGLKIKPRFEFVLVFAWKEPTPSDKLRPIKAVEAAAPSSGGGYGGMGGGSPASSAGPPPNDGGGGGVRAKDINID